MPGAALGAWVAANLVGIANILASEDLGGYERFVTAIIGPIATTAAGAVFIYAGTRLAPSRKMDVALGLASIAVVLAGWSIVTALVRAEYTAIAPAVALILGAAAAAFHVRSGDVLTAN